MKTLTMGYSPCPNDTFLFYALAHGAIDTEGYRFEPVLEDVETLNRWALKGRLHVTKASYGVLGKVSSRYWCLRSGGALGRGCGPLVVAKRGVPLEELARGRIAVPGRHTTANTLLDLRLSRPIRKITMIFHEIMPAVARGDVDAGVIIHEGRFTYGQHGLIAIEDLGEWWESKTGLPIPLGAILLRRSLKGVDPVAVERIVRRSAEYAFIHPAEPMEYVRRHAQELEESVIQEHIRLYANSFSVDLGDEGARAVEEFVGPSGPSHRPSEGLFPRQALS